MTMLTITMKIRTMKMATAMGTMTKMMMTMNDDYETMTLIMMLTTMTTTMTTSMMTTMMTTTKISREKMNNLAIIFHNIIMII